MEKNTHPQNTAAPTAASSNTTALQNATLLRGTASLVNFFGSGNVDKGEILKFTDRWSLRGGAPLQAKGPLLVIFPEGPVVPFRMLRRWQPTVETIVPGPGAELPDPDEMNSRIPREEWELDRLTGQPRAPWSKYFILYLLDPTTAALFTYYNNTIGCRMLVTRIEERVQWGRALFGDDAMLLAQLADRPFHTQYGERRAPDLEVLGFRRFAGGGLRVIDQAALEEVRLPPPKDTLGDEIAF
jgi:hypothetical protein